MPRVAIPTPAAVAPVLVDARHALERQGWTTERARAAGDDPAWSPARTITEAIEYVVPWDGETPRAVVEYLCERLELVADDPWTALAAWNEAPERWLGDVLEALT
jgi:hypothetical protein